jgi:hypothetical protein
MLYVDNLGPPGIWETIEIFVEILVDFYMKTIYIYIYIYKSDCTSSSLDNKMCSIGELMAKLHSINGINICDDFL